jgi:hypothetical protein
MLIRVPENDNTIGASCTLVAVIHAEDEANQAEERLDA